LLKTLKEDARTAYSKDPVARSVLELEGEEEEIEQAITWVTSKEVRVDPVIGDIVEE